MDSTPTLRMPIALRLKDYWAAVRAAWDAIIRHDNGITVPEQAENGSTSGGRLMSYADGLNDGKLTAAEAVAKAKLIIAEVTALR